MVTDPQALAEPSSLPYDAPPADILDAAAAIIETNGRHVGNYWDALIELDTRQSSPWRPGTPCCTAAAIGVAIGLRRMWDVEAHIVPASRPEVFADEAPHPAFRALMTHLGAYSIETVFDWSDEHGKDEIAATMRECAAALRAGVAA